MHGSEWYREVWRWIACRWYQVHFFANYLHILLSYETSVGETVVLAVRYEFAVNRSLDLVYIVKRGILEFRQLYLNLIFMKALKNVS